MISLRNSSILRRLSSTTPGCDTIPDCLVWVSMIVNANYRSAPVNSVHGKKRFFQLFTVAGFRVPGAFCVFPITECTRTPETRDGEELKKALFAALHRRGFPGS